MAERHLSAEEARIEEESRMLSPEKALEKRQQLIEEGYCVVEDILPADFLAVLRQATDLIVQVDPGRLSQDQTLRALERMAREVLPALRTLTE